MHGFDIMQKAKTTKVAVKVRMAFMKKVFIQRMKVNGDTIWAMF